MIEKLKEIINSQEFLTALDSPELWKSLDVDYHPPRVELVFKMIGDYRLSLHAIHPCETNESLIHLHPWQSAMFVLGLNDTIYEHGVGYCKNSFILAEPEYEIVCRQEYKGEVYYEMLYKKGVHYVRPINGIVYSIMLTGPVIWPENNVTVGKELQPLTDERKAQILETFKTYFK